MVLTECRLPLLHVLDLDDENATPTSSVIFLAGNVIDTTVATREDRSFIIASLDTTKSDTPPIAVCDVKNLEVQKHDFLCLGEREAEDLEDQSQWKDLLYHIEHLRKKGQEEDEQFT